eukprot:UC4_evm3s1044
MGKDIDGEDAGDESGTSVSLSSDGTRVAIGARYNDGNGDKAGHVRVYETVSPTTTDSLISSSTATSTTLAPVYGGVGGFVFVLALFLAYRYKHRNPAQHAPRQDVPAVEIINPVHNTFKPRQSDDPVYEKPLGEMSDEEKAQALKEMHADAYNYIVPGIISGQHEHYESPDSLTQKGPSSTGGNVYEPVSHNRKITCACELNFPILDNVLLPTHDPSTLPISQP